LRKELEQERYNLSLAQQDLNVERRARLDAEEKLKKPATPRAKKVQ
jgi:hypothetical protein